jgi:hypothetical protein
MGLLGERRTCLRVDSRGEPEQGAPGGPTHMSLTTLLGLNRSDREIRGSLPSRSSGRYYKRM